MLTWFCGILEFCDVICSRLLRREMGPVLNFEAMMSQQ